jgi:hypothetical protein
MLHAWCMLHACELPGGRASAFACPVSAVFLALKMEEEKPMKLPDVTTSRGASVGVLCRRAPSACSVGLLRPLCRTSPSAPLSHVP